MVALIPSAKNDSRRGSRRTLTSGRSQIPWRADRQHAALSFDHHVSRVCGGGCRQCRTRPTALLDLAPQIQRRSWYAKSAAGQEQPCAPVTRRRLLLQSPLIPPIPPQSFPLILRYTPEPPSPLPFGQRGDQICE